MPPIKAAFICGDIEKNIISVISDRYLSDIVFLVADFTNDGEALRAKEIIKSIKRCEPQLIIGIEINPDATVKMLKEAYDVLSYGMDILLPFNGMAVSRNIVLNDKEHFCLSCCQPIKMIVAANIPGLLPIDFFNIVDILSRAGVAHYVFGCGGEDACVNAVQQALDSYSGDVELKDFRRVFAVYMLDFDCTDMVCLYDSSSFLYDSIDKGNKGNSLIYSAAVRIREMEVDKVEFLAILIENTGSMNSDPYIGGIM